MSTTADRHFAERLVVEVEQREFLYNTKHQDYKDRFKVEMEWDFIAAVMGSTAEITKRKWQNLRGSYSKSLGLKYNVPSGSAAKAKSRFYLAEQMEFLKPHICPGPAIGNYSFNNSNSTFHQVESPKVVEDSSQDRTPSSPIATILTTPEGEEEEGGEGEGDQGAPPRSMTPTYQLMPKQTGRKRKQPDSDAVVSYLEHKTDKNDSDEQSPQDKSDMNFFNGLVTQVSQLNKGKKRQYFKEITALVFEKLEEQEQEENATAVDDASRISSLDETMAKRKWANLRDYFQRQLRETHTTTKSGSSAAKKKKWALYDAMSFLDNYLTARPPNSGNPQESSRPLDINAVADNSNNNDDEVDDEVTHPTPTPTFPPQDTTTPMPKLEVSDVVASSSVLLSTLYDTCTEFTESAKRKNKNARKTKDDSPQSQLLEREILEIIQKIATTMEEDDNEDFLFFKNLLPKMKCMTDLQKLELQADVINVFLNHLKRATATDPSPSRNDSSGSVYYEPTSSARPDDESIYIL